jgi:Tol biopolymer transport system component
MRIHGPLVATMAWLGLLGGCATLDGLAGGGGAGSTPAEGGDAGSADARVALDGPDGSSVDATTDSAPKSDAAACDLNAPWGEPTPLAELNSASDDWAPRLTSDELTIVFSSARPGSVGLVSLYVATRASRTLPFSNVGLLAGSVNTSGIVVHPSITGDGLTLYYQSKTTPTGTSGPDRTYVAKRPNTLSSFGLGTIVRELEPPASGDYDVTPFVIADGSRVVFASTRGRTVPDFDIFESTLQPGGSLGAPVRIDTVSDTPGRDDTPVLSSDGLTLYFASYRLNLVTGDFDIFRATRPSTTAPFGAPVRVLELVTTGYEAPGWVSPDGCRMYMLSNRVVDGGSGQLDLFVTQKP